MDTGPAYTYFADLAAEAGQVAKDSILSRQLDSSEHAKVTLFSFSAGQELTEHAAAWPAILYFVTGEADLVLGGEHRQAQAGTYVRMPARLPHSLVARTPLVMLLILLV